MPQKAPGHGALKLSTSLSGCGQWPKDILCLTRPALRGQSKMQKVWVGSIESGQGLTKRPLEVPAAPAWSS